MSYVNTGRWIVGRLRQVAVSSTGDRIPTGDYKPNVISDPDYVAPIDSEDSQEACPLSYVRINYEVIEPSSPYADANMQIKVNGIVVKTVVSNGVGYIDAPAGSIIIVEASGELPTTGDNPLLHLNVKEDGSTIFDETEPDSPPPTVVIASTPFLAHFGSIYDILVQSSANATTTTTTLSPEGEVNLSSDGTCPYTIDSVTGGGTGLPDMSSANVTPGTSQSFPFVGTISIQTITINVSGSFMAGFKISITPLGESTTDIPISGAGGYIYNLGSAVNAPDTLTIQIIPV